LQEQVDTIPKIKKAPENYIRSLLNESGSSIPK
jgi:hypothetical protein